MEIWKDIQGYEGLYQVSNYGNVKSLRSGKLLVPCKNQENCGHLHLQLYKDKKAKTHYVHRLVAVHFVPNPNNLGVVNHKDYNSLNNNSDNLEWCTQQQNVQYSSERMKKPKERHKISNTGEKYIRKVGNKYYVYIRRDFYVHGAFRSLDEAIAFRDGVLV